MSPERQRLEVAYAEHASAVLAYARRRTDPATADDVLSEVFLAAWRRIDELPAAPRPWLLGVARKVLANQRRSGERQAAVGERLATHTPLATPGPAADGEDGAVLRALATLLADDRELLLLVAWDELTPREAAAVLGINAAACSMRLTRARRRLAAALAAADVDGDPDIGGDDDGSRALTALPESRSDRPNLAAPEAPAHGVDALARLVAAAPSPHAGWRLCHA